MDRDQAIEWLDSMGVKAFKRDWVYGKTITIPVGEYTAQDGTNLNRGMLCLYPDVDGRWHLQVFPELQPPEPQASYLDLESAIVAALEFLAKIGPPC